MENKSNSPETKVSKTENRLISLIEKALENHERKKSIKRQRLLRSCMGFIVSTIGTGGGIQSYFGLNPNTAIITIFIGILVSIVFWNYKKDG